MKAAVKRLIRPVLFIGAGAAAGLMYYHFFGCANGCPITSSPLNTMIYTAVMGWLLSGLFTSAR